MSAEARFCLREDLRAIRDSIINEARPILEKDQYSNYAAISIDPHRRIHVVVLDNNNIDIRLVNVSIPDALRIVRLLAELKES